MESLGGSRRGQEHRPGLPATNHAQGFHHVHEIRPVSPQPAGQQRFALTPQRDDGQQHQQHHVQSQARPKTAPGTLRPSSSAILETRAEQHKVHGRASLYDKQHEYLGPKVLRDWDRSVGSATTTPEQFLRKGDAQDLRTRTTLAKWLQRHPGSREPPFQPGTAGVHLQWGSAPQPQTLFRYLRDNGTIDFVRMGFGGLQNHVEWGKQVRPGLMSWDRRPEDVSTGQWLPIFLEGIREYEEPCRFLAIRGSESLILEAGGKLHEAAADCVPPLRKALESREPTTVAVALELMLLSLKVDPKVAQIWIYQLWQFAQIMNLFLQRKFTVNLGYNTREIASVRQLVSDILILLEEHGGEHATGLVRRYCRVDPAVTVASQLRRVEKEKQRASHRPFTPFTLF